MIGNMTLHNIQLTKSMCLELKVPLNEETWNVNDVSILKALHFDHMKRNLHQQLMKKFLKILDS